MVQTFPGLTLKALACALPQQTRDVASFKTTFDADKVERFREVVGIERFHVAPEGMKTSDLAVAAAEKLFTSGAVAREAVDALLFITQTPDAVAPATSALLQARLGLPTHLLALDINQGCAGFLSGMLTAAHLLASPTIRTVMVLGGDTLTRCVDASDPATAMLFGDAGFAAVFTNEGAETCHIASGLASSTAITIPHGETFQMAGTEVFNFTITQVPEQILEVMRAANVTVDQLDLLLLHQANQFIVRQVARMCRVPTCKVPCRIAQRGNTSVASLPLLLCDLKQEGFTGQQRVVMSAFGVGLSWITTACTLDFDACHAPILIPESN